MEILADVDGCMEFCAKELEECIRIVKRKSLTGITQKASTISRTRTKSC